MLASANARASSTPFPPTTLTDYAGWQRSRAVGLRRRDCILIGGLGACSGRYDSCPPVLWLEGAGRVERGKRMTVFTVYWFVRRKAKIIFLTVMTYAALC